MYKFQSSSDKGSYWADMSGAGSCSLDTELGELLRLLPNTVDGCGCDGAGDGAAGLVVVRTVSAEYGNVYVVLTPVVNGAMLLVGVNGAAYGVALALLFGLASRSAVVELLLLLVATACDEVTDWLWLAPSAVLDDEAGSARSPGSVVELVCCVVGGDTGSILEELATSVPADSSITMSPDCGLSISCDEASAVAFPSLADDTSLSHVSTLDDAVELSAASRWLCRG